MQHQVEALRARFPFRFLRRNPHPADSIESSDPDAGIASTSRQPAAGWDDRRGRRRRSGTLLLILVAGLWLAWSRVRPSLDRHWIPEQSRLPTATSNGSRVAIDNSRDFDWSADSDPVERWESRGYDVDTIESVWFVLTPFATDWRGPAHAFLSFGFADSQYVAISIEARREIGESYSIIKGLLKRFEMMYVIGTERDLIGRRTEMQHDEVYVYPVRADRAAVRRLFIDMLERANELAGTPRFYGSLRNNCTTAILEHVNRLPGVHVPYSWRILLPGYSDELALGLGLIDTGLSLEAARARYRINERAHEALTGDDFSTRIRTDPVRATVGRTPLDEQ